MTLEIHEYFFINILFYGVLLFFKFIMAALCSPLNLFLFWFSFQFHFPLQFLRWLQFRGGDFHRFHKRRGRIGRRNEQLRRILMLVREHQHQNPRGGGT